MHPRTVATLEELEVAEWFSAVGVRDTEGAHVLSSWDEAIASCSAPEWEELCLEAANRYTEKLARLAPKRFARWNDLVAEVRPHVDALVEAKTQGVRARHELPQVFTDVVQWDMIHVCMEAEYADVYPPGFYASQAYWYCKGHFPCGWRGAFPEGKLVVY